MSFRIVSPPAISFTGVGQDFVREDRSILTAISDLTFDVRQHEFVAVLGPSGCGKSTLMRQIAGLTLPTSGQLKIFGKPVSGPREDIGIVFQKPTLLPWFDVLGNITFPMRHKNGRVTRSDEDRARELLKLTDLESFAHANVEDLSGGMQQRVAIARSLLLEPDILLMDEPFSALDALSRDIMSFELLRIWSEKPKAVLFITHSIPEALLLADRIVVMSSRPGTVLETIETDLARPRTLETLRDPKFNDLANHVRALLYARHAA